MKETPGKKVDCVGWKREGLRKHLSVRRASSVAPVEGLQLGSCCQHGIEGVCVNAVYHTAGCESTCDLSSGQCHFSVREGAAVLLERRGGSIKHIVCFLWC